MARDAGLPLRAAGADHAGHDRARRHAFARALRRTASCSTQKPIAWFFDQYIDARRPRRLALRARCNADDLEGVAPAWIVLAECDPLVDEGIAYADKLRAAGVPVDLEIYRGVTHDFIKMGRVLPEAAQAQQAIADALEEAFDHDDAREPTSVSSTACACAGPRSTCRRSSSTATT